LTLEYEKKRLKLLGIEKDPYLVSLEDETAGYDVHSYLSQDGRVVPYYIEVKGTTAFEPRFFVSRNEWDACVRLQPQYVIHLWNLGTKSLTILSKEDLEPHIAVDRGLGTWMDIRIPFVDTKGK